MPVCARCRMRKHPWGRDPGAAADSYCGWDCPGYAEEPKPGHLWPGELARSRADAAAEE